MKLGMAANDNVSHENEQRFKSYIKDSEQWPHILQPGHLEYSERESFADNTSSYRKDNLH
jgi:hypothetical protein